MGADIYGFAEIFKNVPADGPEAWVGVMRLHELVERNYGMFGALFGVRNIDGFVPAFAGRGLPADASEATAIESSDLDGGVRPSWILWSELSAVEWDAIGSKQLRETHVKEEHRGRKSQHNPSFVISSSTETPLGPQVRRSRKGHPEAGEETIAPREMIAPGIKRVGSRSGDIYYARTARYSVREIFNTWVASMF